MNNKKFITVIIFTMLLIVPPVWADTLGVKLTASEEAGSPTGDSSRMSCNAYTAVQSGTVIAMTWYGNGTGNLATAIYSDNNNRPYQRIAKSSSSVTISSKQEYTVPINANIVADTKYWLCFSGNGTVKYGFRQTTAANGDISSGTGNWARAYDDWPDLFDGDTRGERQALVYATYTSGNVAVPAPIPDPIPIPTPSPSGNILGTKLSSTEEAASPTGQSSRMSCNKYTATETGTVSSVTWYGSGTGNLVSAFYSDNNNRPYKKIATSSSVAISTKQEYTMPIDLNIGANTAYWLCFSGDGTVNYSYRPVAVANGDISSGTGNWVPGHSYDSWPNPFDGDVQSTRQPLLYATYTPGNVTPTEPLEPLPTPPSGGDLSGVGNTPVFSGISKTLYTLIVDVKGAGKGTTSGTGILCPQDCTELMTPGSSVTLTATPAAGSTFIGWFGDCTGTGSCTVTANSNLKISAIFDAIPQPMVTPTNLRVTESYYRHGAVNDANNPLYLKDLDMYIYWDDNSSEEDGFEIERSTDRGLHWSVVQTNVANATLYLPSDMMTDQIYQIRVRAFQKSGPSKIYSAYSNTMDIAGLPQATYQEITASEVDSVKIIWNSRFSDATPDGRDLGWQIERSDDNGVTYKIIAQRITSGFNVVSNAQKQHGNTKEYIDTALTPGKTYYYRIAAWTTIPGQGATRFHGPYTGTDTSAAALPYVMITPGGVPNSPGLRAVATGTSKVTLGFIDHNINNASEAIIERSTDGVNWVFINNTWPGRELEDTTVQPLGRYYYRIYAKTKLAGVQSPYVYINPIVIPNNPPAGVNTSWYVWRGASEQRSGESWINAWRDVDQINWNAIHPGDTIYISGDNYNSGLTVFSSGIQGKPINIKTGALAPDPNNHSGRVVMKGISIVGNWVTVDGSIDPNYVPRTAFNIDKNINLELNGSDGDGIYVTYPTGINLRFLKVANTANHGIILNNNRMDYNEIYGVHVTHVPFQGIHVPYNGLRQRYDCTKISKTLIEYIGGDGIFSGGGMTISDVVIRYGYPNFSSGHPDGIQTLNANYLDVHNTTIYDRDHSSYMIVTESAYEGATISHVRIYNNLFYYSDPAQAPITEGIYLLASANFTSPIIGTPVNNQSWDDVVIANNTFYNLRQTAPISLIVRPNGEVKKVNVSNFTIKNNLIDNVNDLAPSGAINVSNLLTIGSGVSIENNIVTGTNTRISYQNATYANAEDFNMATGFKFNTSATPKFLDLPGLDLHLDPTDTVAIGKGANLSQYFSRDKDNYARPSTGPWDIGAFFFTKDKGLLVRLDFTEDDPSNGKFKDTSDNGNDADCQKSMVVGGVSYQRDQCPAISTGPDGSRAMSFSGSLCNMDSDYLALPSTPQIANLEQGSVSFWVNNSDSLVTVKVLDTYTAKMPNTWLVAKDGEEYYTLTANTDNGVEADLFSFPTAPINTWNHYAFSWDGKVVKGYFNGKNFGQVPMTGMSSFAMSDYLAIGANKHNYSRNYPDSNCGHQYQPVPMPQGPYAYPNTGFLNGQMDDIRIYDRALSDTEIANLASKTMTLSSQKVLIVTRSGTGLGGVVGGGILCGKHCGENFNSGSNVTLSILDPRDSTPMIDIVSKFSGWAGACSGNANTCTVRMDSDQNVIAKFDRKYPTEQTIDVTKAVLTLPFREAGGTISQPVDPQRRVDWSGLAVFKFHVAQAGSYYIVGNVDAPSDASNSFYANVDTDPGLDEAYAWHLGFTAGFEDRVIDWGLDKTNPNIENRPNPGKLFTLPAGDHYLYLRGREAGASISSISIINTGKAIIFGSGDVSGDGKVTMYDAALALRYSITGGGLTQAQIIVANVDGNKNPAGADIIDNTDVIAITKKALGL